MPYLNCLILKLGIGRVVFLPCPNCADAHCVSVPPCYIEDVSTPFARAKRLQCRMCQRLCWGKYCHVKIFVKIVKIVKKVGLDVTKVGLGVTKKAFPAGTPVCISRMSWRMPYTFLIQKNPLVYISWMQRNH